MLRSKLAAIAVLNVVIWTTTLATEGPANSAAQTVLDFNAAVTSRDMDTAMALLADGGVQFHLRPAHPGMPENHPLTEDMATMWKTVSAILFPTTNSYERKVEILSTHIEGELAVVWTQTRTITDRKSTSEPMVLDFLEMYFLVNKDNTGWRIAGTTTNRPLDAIPVG